MSLKRSLEVLFRSFSRASGFENHKRLMSFGKKRVEAKDWKGVDTRGATRSTGDPGIAGERKATPPPNAIQEVRFEGLKAIPAGDATSRENLVLSIKAELVRDGTHSHATAYRVE